VLAREAQFGIDAAIRCGPRKSHYDLTWEIVRQMIHADEMNFDSYSVIKHHFFPQFGTWANPLAMFAAALSRAFPWRDSSCHAATGGVFQCPD
jgi:hypothetical protein